jgi:hypothetical protein
MPGKTSQLVLRELLQFLDAGNINFGDGQLSATTRTPLSIEAVNDVLICDSAVFVIERTWRVEMQIPAVPK